ncbi:MAG: phosphoribosylamine--glycine ligase [Candidatus Moraniibacteriota bacterium]
MKVLLIGSGGREHALALKISESPLVSQVYCAPGNAGTSQCAINVNIGANDIASLVKFAKEEGIDLTVVGPEKPLTDGIVEVFKANGLAIFGPDSEAAELEGSKWFMKRLLTDHGISTAKYFAFTNRADAEKCVKNHNYPLVVKADGLAAGKGVFVCKNLEEAMSAIKAIMIDRDFGDSGNCILVEDFVEGEEASFITLVDFNQNILELEPTQDHKAVGDGDIGPNTGGMGAYSPAPVVSAGLRQRIMTEIIRPTVTAMFEEYRPYTGFLYCGLIIDKQGNPIVLEYNVRLGDPETQPLMMRWQGDIVPVLLAALDGKLDQCQITWSDQVAVYVVLAAKGYPGSDYQKGFAIDGLSEVKADGASVYHAGTKLIGDKIVGSGGRVVGVGFLGGSFLEAQQKTYQAIKKIESGDNLFWRTDIAHRAINR